MIASRHTATTGIAFKMFAPGHWQHVDMNDKGRFAQVGPLYRTKSELLADHEDYLKRAGWMAN